MATKKPDERTPPATKKPDAGQHDGRGPRRKDDVVRTQMVGEHGDDDLGYDPAIIPTEKIPED